MKMRSLRPAFVLLLAIVPTIMGATCASPMPEVRRGSAPTEPPQRLVIMPASCGSVEELCEDAFLSGVTQMVKDELEFAGFSVIDAEKIVLEARTDEQAPAPVRAFGERVLRAANARQMGGIFDEMTPAARAALLSQAGADALVSVRIGIATPDGVFGQRDTQVLIRVGHGAKDELAWVSRCSQVAGWQPPLPDAVDDASRCALGGIFPHAVGK